MTRAEAIAIFEANTVPGKMVTDEAHYIQEAGDWRAANRVAEARIADLERQLAYATVMALDFNDRLNKSSAAQASCEDELYDARRDIIALRERAAVMAKGISERDSLLGELRQQLADTTASEAVMADDFAALELQLADARSSEGVTGAQLATAEATIADLRKQATAGAERGLTVDQVFARTAAMCLAAKYAPGTIRGCADEIVNDAYILVAALNAEEAKQ